MMKWEYVILTYVSDGNIYANYYDPSSGIPSVALNEMSGQGFELVAIDRDPESKDLAFYFKRPGAEQ